MALEPHIRRGRITSLFGTYLPPKKKTRATKYLTVSFIVLGTVPSKKNMIWASSNLNQLKNTLLSFGVVKTCIEWLFSHVKVFIRNSGKYLEWVEEQKPIVQEQAKTWHEKYKRFGLQFPLNDATISVYHYWGDNMERDLTNKLDSITDLMVSAGIIVNDSWQFLKKIHSESENYSGEVNQTITRIDITQAYRD
jgi:hypothetical protein